jgi:hypothetical protein
VTTVKDENLGGVKGGICREVRVLLERRPVWSLWIWAEINVANGLEREFAES